jgi:hypothetical protein
MDHAPCDWEADARRVLRLSCRRSLGTVTEVGRNAPLVMVPLRMPAPERALMPLYDSVSGTICRETPTYMTRAKISAMKAMMVVTADDQPDWSTQKQ